MLDEGLKEVVSLDASVKFGLNGKLVHHVGYLQTDQVCSLYFLIILLLLNSSFGSHSPFTEFNASPFKF